MNLIIYLIVSVHILQISDTVSNNRNKTNKKKQPFDKDQFKATKILDGLLKNYNRDLRPGYENISKNKNFIFYNINDT